MTPKERAAMQQALEALCQLHFAATERDKKNRVRWFDKAIDESVEAITALRKALAEQAEQEPVAYAGMIDGNVCAVYTQWPVSHYHKIKPLYTAPVRTKDLTDDEIESIVDSVGAHEVGCWQHVFARAVIAADREKNK